MNRLRDIARAVIISPEALTVVGIITVQLLVPDLIAWLVSQVAPDDFGGKVILLGLPLALLGVNFGLAYGLLNPDESRQMLKEWPQYWRLKLRAYLALYWAVAGIVGTYSGWFLFTAGHPLLGPTLLVGGLLVPSIAALTLGAAKLELRDILDGL